jgi:hypothetical protein
MDESAYGPLAAQVDPRGAAAARNLGEALALLQCTSGCFAQSSFLG